MAQKDFYAENSLALIVDGSVQLGVMGCPNLPVDSNVPEGERGCLFIAEKDQGAFQVYTLNFLGYCILSSFLYIYFINRGISHQQKKQKSMWLIFFQYQKHHF